jgi:gluconokinase
MPTTRILPRAAIDWRAVNRSARRIVSRGSEVARVLAQPHAEPLVVACSALRRDHRDRLRRACPDLRLVFLRPSVATLQRRLTARRDHFAAPTLLASQLATLEPPEPDEGALFVDNEDAVEAVTARLVATL